MKKYIVIMALVSGFAPWSMQAMNQMQIFAGQNQAAQAEQQADLTVRTSDEQQVIIPGNRIRYFKTLSDMMIDTSGDNSAIPLPPVSRAIMQQLLTDLQLIMDQQHAANTGDQAIVHAAAQSKITELSEQDFINARNAAQFLQSDLLLQLYDRDGITKAIAPILISDASMQALYDNNADCIQHILSMRSTFKDEIYHYIKPEIWLETNALMSHTRGIKSVAFSLDGKKIVIASNDGTAKIWDASTGECLHILEGHTDLVFLATFSLDGKKIVTASFDKTAKIWDVLTGQCLHTLEGHTCGIGSVGFSPNGKKIVTASDDKTARIWDVSTGQCLHTLEGHTNWVWPAGFSPDGKKIVTASWDNTAKIWDAITGECLHTLEGHTHWVCSAAFSPDGKKVATASWDNTAKIWDVLTGQRLHTLEGHTGGIDSAAFSPDGTKIVTASYAKTAKIWDALTGECLHTLESHICGIDSAAFSPDGKKIVTASDRTARIWDVLTGECLHTLEGHTQRVFSAAFSPDGKKIVTASDDNTARIWQLFPAHNFDQALFARLLAWAKRNGHAAAWQAGWARNVMNTYSAEDQAKIKEMYPKPHQSIMQRISGYLSLLDA